MRRLETRNENLFKFIALNVKKCWDEIEKIYLFTFYRVYEILLCLHFFLHFPLLSRVSMKKNHQKLKFHRNKIFSYFSPIFRRCKLFETSHLISQIDSLSHSHRVLVFHVSTLFTLFQWAFFFFLASSANILESKTFPRAKQDVVVCRTRRSTKTIILRRHSIWRRFPRI